MDTGAPRGFKFDARQFYSDSNNDKENSDDEFTFETSDFSKSDNSNANREDKKSVSLLSRLIAALVKGMYMLLTVGCYLNPFYWVMLVLSYLVKGFLYTWMCPWHFLKWITATKPGVLQSRNPCEPERKSSSLGFLGWTCYLLIMAGSMFCYSVLIADTESKVLRHYMSLSFPIFVCGAVHSLHKSSTVLLCASVGLAMVFMLHLNPNALVPQDNSVFSAEYMYQWFNRFFDGKHQGMNMQTPFAIINFLLTKCSFQRNSDACSEAFARADWFRGIFNNATYEFLEEQSYIGEVYVNVPYLNHNEQPTDDLMTWTECKAKFNTTQNDDYSLCALYFIQHRYQLGLNVRDKLLRWKTTIQPLMNISTSVGAVFFEKNSYARESLTFMANAFMGWIQCSSSLISGLNMAMSGVHMVDTNPVNDLFLKLGNYFADYFSKFVYEDYTTQAVSRVIIDFPLVHFQVLPAKYQAEWKMYTIPYNNGEVVIKHDVAANMPMKGKIKMYTFKEQRCPSLEKIKNISWNLRDCKDFEVFIMQVIDSSFDSNYPPNECPKSCKQRYQTTGCLQSTEAVIQSQIEALNRERISMKAISTAPRESKGEFLRIQQLLSFCNNSKIALENQSKIDKRKYNELLWNYTLLSEKLEENQKLLIDTNKILEEKVQQNLIEGLQANIALVECNSINAQQVKAIEEVLNSASVNNAMELSRLIQRVIATPGNVAESIQSFYTSAGKTFTDTKNSMDKFSDALKWLGIGISGVAVAAAMHIALGASSAKAATAASMLATAATQAPPVATVAAGVAAPVVAAAAAAVAA